MPARQSDPPTDLRDASAPPRRPSRATPRREAAEVRRAAARASFVEVAEAARRARAVDETRRPPRRALGRAMRESLSLTLAGAAAIAAVALLARAESAAPRETHGVVAVLFPPWMPESEKLRRVDAAGGVAVATPGRPSRGVHLESVYLRVIVDDPAFAARARALGAWAVAPFAGP